MNFSNLSKKATRKIGAALMPVALMAGALSASGAPTAYYAGRRGNYSRRNQTYLVDEDLIGISHDLLKYKQTWKISDGPFVNISIDDVVLTKRSAVRELIIVDQNLKGYQQFSSLARPGVEVVEIPQSADGFGKLMEILSQYKDLDAVHLFSHATSGQLLLGSGFINTEELKTKPELLQTINNAIKAGGDLLFYGCELGSGNMGEEFLEIIKGNTHIDVAASNDLTGHAAYNGDWDLEIQKGDINTSPVEGSIALKDFTGVMQVTFPMNLSQIVSYGSYLGSNNNAQVHENGGSSFTMTIDGHSDGTFANGMYVYLGGGGGSRESGVTLSFTGGQTFDPESIQLFTSIATTFTITTNIGGTVTRSLGVNGSATIDLTSLPSGATSLIITGSTNFSGWLDNVVFTSVSAPPDITPPAVSSITKSGSPAANASSVTFAVNFNENANNISIDDFQVTTVSGTATGTVSSVSASSGTSVNVTVTGITGTGSIRLDLKSNTNITDNIGNGNNTNGYVVAYSSGATHTVDRDAPAAPSTPDLATASDLGSSSTDNVTSDNTPTFTGTAEANSTVTVISSVSGTLGTTTANGAGNWSYTAGSMTAGAHTITATATDAAGNTSSASSGLSITIDVTAPAAPSTPDLATASDLGSSSTDNVTSDNTPTFTGTAEANSTVTVISSGSGTLGTTTADGAGNWSYTAGTMASGAHTITATATDAAGNTSSASSGLSITIDATAPAAPSTPDLATASDLGSSSTDNVTSDNTPTFTGTAEANSTVTVISSVSGTLGTTTADGAGNWSYTAGTMASGAHTITATATDAAGNTSSASSGLSITIDVTAPAISSLSPTDESVNVTVNTNLVATFNQNIMAGTGNILIKKISDNTTVQTIAITDNSQVSISGTTLTINPSTDLPVGEGLYVNIESGAISDDAGNSFAGISTNSTWNFTTLSETGISVNDASVAEGNTGTIALVFTVSLSQPAPAGGVTVDYATSNGTAATGIDYSAASGTVTFAAGETSKDVSVTVASDAILEANETILLTLSNATGSSVVITDASGTGTITNDDAATLTIADVSGNENAGAITVTVTLDNEVQGGFTVDVSTSDATASAGADYTSVSGQTLTFAGTAGESQTFTITPTADSDNESDETINVSLSNLAGTTLPVVITDGAAVTIVNDDTPTGIRNANKNQFSVYPNPFANFLNITSDINNPMELRLFDARGNEVIDNATSVNNGKIENLENLSPGMYILQIKQNDTIYHYQIMKQ